MLERDFRPHAADGVDEQPEQSPLRRAHKAVEHMGILPHHQVRQQFYRLAGRGQLVERRQRNERLIPHAVDLHRHLRGQRLDQFALQKSNHSRGLIRAARPGRVRPGYGNADGARFRRHRGRC